MSGKLLIRYVRCIITILTAISFIMMPVEGTSFALDSLPKATVEVSKTKLMPLESFTATVKNVPSSEPTQLIFIPSEDKNYNNSVTVYRFMGNERSVIYLCAPRKAGAYRLLLIKESSKPYSEPVLVSSGPVFRVADVYETQEEKQIGTIDSFDLVSRPGLTDFGFIQLFHKGKTVKGFSTWNNTQLKGEIKRLVKGQYICVGLQWTSYTSNGKPDKKGDMIINISPDGEAVYGRYHLAGNGYWTPLKGAWSWPDPLADEEGEPLIYCREDSGIRLMWSRNLIKGDPAGYNLFVTDSKGKYTGKPINKKLITGTDYLVNSIDLSKSYVVTSVARDGKQVPVTKVTEIRNLNAFFINVNGLDAFDTETVVSCTANKSSRTLTVDAGAYMVSIAEAYNELYWEKHPDRYPEETNEIGIVATESGDSITLTYMGRSLLIKAESMYYWSNGTQKAWDSIMKKSNGEYGYTFFEVPFNIINDALGIKAQPVPNSNLINITLEIR